MTVQDNESPDLSEFSEGDLNEIPQSEKAALEKEVEDLRDKNLRLLAEMENLRKRLTKDKQDSTRFAVEGLVCDFLSPMDNLENALSFSNQMSPETQNWALGFQMILGQFKEVLSENGIASYKSEGSLFDPHLHEAVEVEETTQVADGTILKEFAKGYRAGARIVRPAKVKVAKAPSPLENSDTKS